MTAFQNAIDLRLAVSDIVGKRPIADVWPVLVTLCESELNGRLRTRHQVTEATLTFDDGVCPIPADYLEMIEARDVHGCEVHPRYSADDFNLIIPGFNGEITIRYYAKLPSLTKGGNACNWLLRHYPKVYLYGVALEAAKWHLDEDLATKIDQLFAHALQTVESDDYRARWSNQVVRVQGQTP